MPLKNSRTGKGIAKKKKAKGNGDKSIACVKCYNCGRKGPYAWDCPEPNKVPFPTKIPEVNVCSHAIVANSLPQWIEDTGTTEHIVQDQAGFMEFHRYLVDPRIIVLGNGSDQDVLGEETYQLRLYRGNKMLFHDALYAPMVQCSLVSFISLMRIGFFFQFSY